MVQNLTITSDSDNRGNYLSVNLNWDLPSVVVNIYWYNVNTTSVVSKIHTFSGSSIGLTGFPIPNGATHFAIYTVVNWVESSTPAIVKFTDVVSP